jgi:hypothetical protein
VPVPVPVPVPGQVQAQVPPEPARLLVPARQPAQPQPPAWLELLRVWASLPPSRPVLRQSP